MKIRFCKREKKEGFGIEWCKMWVRGDFIQRKLVFVKTHCSFLINYLLICLGERQYYDKQCLFSFVLLFIIEFSLNKTLVQFALIPRTYKFPISVHSLATVLSQFLKFVYEDPALLCSFFNYIFIYLQFFSCIFDYLVFIYLIAKLSLTQLWLNCSFFPSFF